MAERAFGSGNDPVRDPGKRFRRRRDRNIVPEAQFQLEPGTNKLLVNSLLKLEQLENQNHT